MNKYRVSDMLKILNKVLEEHGDIPVVYASDYDWVMPLGSHDVPSEPYNWDHEPKEKYLYFGN
jgi:hypothetical protein